MSAPECSLENRTCLFVRCTPGNRQGNETWRSRERRKVKFTWAILRSLGHHTVNEASQVPSSYMNCILSYRDMLLLTVCWVRCACLHVSSCVLMARELPY